MCDGIIYVDSTRNRLEFISLPSIVDLRALVCMHEAMAEIAAVSINDHR